MVRSGSRRTILLAVVALLAAAIIGPVSSAGAAPSRAPAAAKDAQPGLAFTGLNMPLAVAVDLIGNVYVADWTNGRIVKLPAGGGPQVTLPFTGMGRPYAVAVDDSGNVYTTEAHGWVVKLPAGGGPQVTLYNSTYDVEGLNTDHAGNLYIVDRVYAHVVEVPASGGAPITLAFSGLSSPIGVALDDAGDVFVADSGNDRIVKLPVGGGPQVTLPFTGLTTPYGVAVDVWGNVFAGDTGHARVVELPAGVGPQVVPGFTYLSSAFGLAVDGQASLYVADTGNNRIAKLPTGSGPEDVLVSSGLSTVAHGLALDGAGNIYVGDSGNNRVMKYPPSGGPGVVVGLTGLNYPVGVAFDRSGNLFVVDQGNQRVLELPTGGGPQVTLGFTGLYNPNWVTVDRQGNVYVVDNGHNRVVKLPAAGGSQVVLGFSGLNNPNGVAVDGAGNVYLADYGNQRVLELPAGGGAQLTRGFLGLTGPTALALDGSGNVFVSDSTSSRVIEVPQGDGSEISLPFSGLHYPVGLAVDGTGSVFLLEQSNGTVKKLATSLPLLRVTTSPAVAADVIVDGVERDSWGLSWVPLALGTHRVCFGAMAGYLTPACQNVNMTVAKTSVVQGTYVSNGYGDLHVTTSPAVPSTISVDGVARNDWGLWTSVPAGAHTVCFGAVAGYNVPACHVVTVTTGATTTDTGTFSNNPSAPGPPAPFGYLRATTSPAVGAVISVDGQARNTWGLDWLKLPVGAHLVCFGTVADMIEPACTSTTITNTNTATVVGTYSPKGTLRVLTNPALPATIYVNGYPSDVSGVWTLKPVGVYNVCFGAVPGYVTPACQSAIAVTTAKPIVVTGTYTPTP